MGTKDFFNNMADTWDELNHYPIEQIEKMLDMIGIKNGETVLDAGTGTGVLLPLLIKRTAAGNITAIDFAEKMIEKAKNKPEVQQVHFITADVQRYPFAAGAFNHIICYSAFPHFRNKHAAVEQFSAALKMGGMLSILHSSSREEINKTHSRILLRGINSDYLLPVRKYLPLLNRNGLFAEHIIDNNEMFMLCARKLPQG